MGMKAGGAGWALAAVGLWLLPAAAGAAERYLVSFEDPVRGRAALAAAGGRIALELWPQGAVAVELPEQAARALASNPAISLIEPDVLRYPLAQTVPYGIGLVQAPSAAADYKVSGAGRRVCIIDSGLGLGHPDLQTSKVSGEPLGWNQDLCGHGTHVAGTVAALDNTVGVVGVLPGGVDLHIVKVFGNDCRWAYVSDLIHAANACAKAGAQVISMSLGGSFKSQTEERAFEQLYQQGLLSVAAAGNGGTGSHSYPASYPSVVSVAALDQAKQVASFSQRNSQVELSAPGVGVLSTVPWRTPTLEVGGATFHGGTMENAAKGSATGALVDGGRCTTTGAWSGKVVLCQRGDNSFYDKVMKVQQSGGGAAVIYNDAEGGFNGTLGSGNTSKIPALTLSGTDGNAAKAKVGQVATADTTTNASGSGYEYWNGTSMATPHVAGVAALVWSYDPRWTNAQVRAALQQSAEDLGPTGRDDAYGHGLVRAKAALDLLTAGGGGGGGDYPILLEVTGSKFKGTKRADLAWSGATTRVDLYVDGSVRLANTANDGSERLELGKGGGTHTFRVCETGTSTCSAEVQVSF